MRLNHGGTRRVRAAAGGGEPAVEAVESHVISGPAHGLAHLMRCEAAVTVKRVRGRKAYGKETSIGVRVRRLPVRDFDAE